MTDYQDLVRSLRARGLSNGSALGHHSGLYDEAADAIEELTGGGDVHFPNRRTRDLLFQTIELLRKEAQCDPRNRGMDWKDLDDWLFAELDFTVGELKEIYAGHPEVFVYIGSAI